MNVVPRNVQRAFVAYLLIKKPIKGRHSDTKYKAKAKLIPLVPYVKLLY